MKKGKLSLIIILIAITIIFLFLYNNILYLDDFHPKFEESLEILAPDTTVISEDNDNNETPKKKKPLYHIHVNLDEKQMYVYKKEELIKTYPVSGGKSTSPSPEGTWVIIAKDNWGEGFGGAWLGFNVPWGKYGIHGTVYPWFVGKQNASKGCIRMLNNDVKELYKLVPHGTTVTIIQENKTFRTLKSGDIGSDVRDVQTALKKLKYYNNWVDGKFGDGLKKSVIKFQKANKLRVTGIVNKSTYDLILQKAREVTEEDINMLE